MARRPDNQIVGVCRFSYPATGGFKLSTKDRMQGDRRALRAGADARRFAYFEKICLPVACRADGSGFHARRSDRRRDAAQVARRLKSLRAEFPFLEICAAEPLGPLAGHAARLSGRCGGRRALRHRLSVSTTMTRWPCDYVERLRTTADRAARCGWADAETLVAISFQSGSLLGAGSTRSAALPLLRSAPGGAGQARWSCPIDSQQNIFRWNHAFLPAHVRCWTDPGPGCSCVPFTRQRQRAISTCKSAAHLAGGGCDAPARALRPGAPAHPAAACAVAGTVPTA
jgi:hypothetical protein